MTADTEFILGLLDQYDPAYVAWEDFDSAHGTAIRFWQRMGFLSRESERNPVPSCPYCYEGVPYWINGRYLCPECHSTVDERDLLLWRFDLEIFLGWLARALKLSGGVRRVDETLWQLGSLSHDGLMYECFFRRGRQLSEYGRERLLAYRNAILFQGPPRADGVDGFRGLSLSLVEVIRQDRGSLTVTDLAQLLHARGAIRLDPESGAIFAGDAFLGEVPMGTKEFHLLLRLWHDADRFVAYGDLKQYVLRQSGSSDTTDDATFCHKLKGRIKDRGWIPRIDALIATTNKGDGYRLRGHLAEP